MARWAPGAKTRLQQAAMALFVERGYGAVTVSDIAERAGLTKRSFFNHFADKREVLFADGDEFIATITDHLAQLDPATSALDAALAALTYGGESLAVYADGAALRRQIIDSTPELQERNLVKLATLTQAIADGLIERGAQPRIAELTAQAAMTVFNTAYDDSIDQPDADFADLMSQAHAELIASLTARDPAASALGV